MSKYTISVEIKPNTIKQFMCVCVCMSCEQCNKLVWYWSKQSHKMNKKKTTKKKTIITRRQICYGYTEKSSFSLTLSTRSLIEIYECNKGINPGVIIYSFGIHEN